MDASLRIYLSILLLALATVSRAQEPLPALHARPVELCEPPANCAQIGRLKLHGVLELPAQSIDNLRFSGLSGLAWDEDAGLLYALSDHGVLFHLRPVFRHGELVDVSLRRTAALTDPRTHKPVRWRRSDSEGLDILNGRNGKPGDSELLVSFEREPRIERYRPDGRYLGGLSLPPALRDVKRYRGGNTMLEAVCHHPREGVLTAPEAPLDNVDVTARLYSLDGRSWRFPANHGGIVALECLPDGDVLVLERYYATLALHWIVTLRRLHLPPQTPDDALLSVETLATLDSDHSLHIDNFEGLARHQGNRFFLVSDDNDVFIQRTLLMYFELTDAPRKP